jgi:serine/threonine protein kinase
LDDEQGITLSGAVLGTPSYMAPEQAAGKRGVVGAVSDVYSLGSVLYHTVTGRPPFQAATSVDTLLLVLEQDPVPPRALNAQLDRDLEMIILRWLAGCGKLTMPTCSRTGACCGCGTVLRC